MLCWQVEVAGLGGGVGGGWGLGGGEGGGVGGGGRWLRVGQPHPMRQIPVPVACRISPTKHCRVAHTLKHIHHCRWWWFPMYIYFIYPKHDAVKIFVCLDIGIWHPFLVYASCILLHVLFANCTLGTFQLDLSNNENSTKVGSRAWP